MKGFCLLSCVCIAMFVSIESKEAVKKYTEKLNKHVGENACHVSSGVTPEYLMQFGDKTIQDFEAPEMADTRNKIGCYVSCLLQKKEMMNGSKVATEKIIDVFKAHMDSSEENNADNLQVITNVVRNCSQEVDSLNNACEVGWKFGKCMSDIIGI